MSAAKLAEFEAYRKQQNLIGTRLVARIVMQEYQIVAFEKQLKKSADPLYDPAEFLQTQGQIQAAFQGHQSPDMNPSMVSAISLVEAMAADVAPAPPADASSGPPAVLVTREKIRQRHRKNLEEVIPLLERSLSGDRDRFKEINEELKTIEGQIAFLKKAAIEE